MVSVATEVPQTHTHARVRPVWAARAISKMWFLGGCIHGLSVRALGGATLMRRSPQCTFSRPLFYRVSPGHALYPGKSRNLGEFKDSNSQEWNECASGGVYPGGERRGYDGLRPLERRARARVVARCRTSSIGLNTRRVLFSGSTSIVRGMDWMAASGRAPVR